VKLKSLEDLRVLLDDRGNPAPGSAAGSSTKAAAREGHDGRGQEVRIRLERKGRKGKTVTLVSGLRHNPDTMRDIARVLKERCGTGGTVKEGNIELQGDRREQAKDELQKMNYVVR